MVFLHISKSNFTLCLDKAPIFLYYDGMTANIIGFSLLILTNYVTMLSTQ